VLFLQGGASLQFLMVPMSFAQEGKPANYINTGQWSKKAISEAKKIGKSVHVAATSETAISAIFRRAGLFPTIPATCTLPPITRSLEPNGKPIRMFQQACP
jgi:hypothetical protein